jgi:hypothetical protein
MVPQVVATPEKSANRLERMEEKVLVTRTADEETEDGRIRNKEAIAKIRDAWVYKQIRARVDEFTEYKQVSRGSPGYPSLAYKKYETGGRSQPSVRGITCYAFCVKANSSPSFLSLL